MIRSATAGLVAVALLLVTGGGGRLAAQSESIGQVVSSVGTTVVVRTDGIQERLQGKGAIQLFDHLGNEIAIPAGKETVALCRCGHSKNKPFCDGSHKQCGFVSEKQG